jgi:phosphomannomutase
MTNEAARVLTPTETHNFHTSILRAYDIRGVVGETLSERDAYILGRCFASFMARANNIISPRIATARDGRVSSPSLSAALQQGMKDAGAIVLDAGVGPTPILYFAAHHLNAHAGIMVTGSHNPPTHNGFKMTLGTKPFYGDNILKLGEMAANGDFDAGKGSIESHPVFNDYVARLLEGFKPANAKDLTVVWDAGNGAAGEVMSALAAKMSGRHILLNEVIDGTFPNHHPDPTVPENLIQLQEMVAREKADVGIAFDGDGDRIGAVDAQGRIIWGDQLLMFYSREILTRKPGATIIADVKASQTLFDDVAAHGGRPIMWKTGHSLIKAKMAEEKAEIAGEMSGHIFFADGYYGFDDGLYAAVRLIDLLAHSSQTLSDMRDTVPDAFNTPEIRMDCTEERKFAIVEEIRNRLKLTSYEVNEVDGVRVKVGNGWWLARASNTQPAIIVRCEAQDETTLAQLVAMVNDQLQQSGVDIHARAAH